MTVSASPRREVVPPRSGVVEYLPGLDGLRALAVIAVVVYHADSRWLPGGFIGVEVFFVLSGYLITRLLVAEHERAGRIDLVRFWGRRARRLLPALLVTLVGVMIATAWWRPDAIGRVRGDLTAAAGYVANWHQIWAGDGYAAAGDFAPLRHLWSLAIEEQFYLVWPIVVLVLLRRGWSRTAIAVGSVSLAVVSAGVTAALAPSGPIGDCAGPDGSWSIAGRCISVADTLYLSTLTRGSGLLLGAAFALVATHRRSRAWNVAGDVLGAAGTAVLVAMAITMSYSAGGVHPFLFRGGFVLVDVATLLLIAAITRPATITARALGARTMLWIGTRSYGLYLYHWPIFQLVRRAAGNPLPLWQFVGAVLASALLADISYRAVELPVRRDGWRSLGRRFGELAVGGGRWAVGVTTVVAVLLAASALRTAGAEPEPNPIEAAIAAGERDVVSVDDLLSGAVGARFTEQPAAPTTVATASPTGRPALPSRRPDSLAVTTPAPPQATAPHPTVPPPATSPPITPAPTSAPPASAPPASAPPAAEPSASQPPDTTTASPPPEPVPTEPAPPPTSAPAGEEVPVADGDLPAAHAPAEARVPMLAIGDSVMLGAAAELSSRGWAVNAEVSRQMVDTVPVLEQLRAAGVFGDVVLIHLGTNGSISDATLDAALAAVAEVPLVILVTIRADRSWADPTSEQIRQRAGGNVVVLDWAVESHQCTGGCFEDDGIHLRAAGRRFYADLVTWTLATTGSS